MRSIQHLMTSTRSLAMRTLMMQRIGTMDLTKVSDYYYTQSYNRYLLLRSNWFVFRLSFIESLTETLSKRDCLYDL